LALAVVLALALAVVLALALAVVLALALAVVLALASRYAKASALALSPRHKKGASAPGVCLPTIFQTHVISTEAAQLHRAAQWRDPCILLLLLL
ncbi:MAG: hypothetical protein J0G35_06920, partial [Acidobacteriales bacterium]|nr:hypothetical protein [Terriglobales bacterium]